MTTRRSFIMGLGGAAAWPRVARAQQTEKMRRIGVLAGSADSMMFRSYIAALRQALQNLGWTEDRNTRMDVRWAGFEPKLIELETAELIATNPDVIVTGTSIAIAQILRASRKIPIVFAGITDPVSQGFTASMARPGGNATGFVAYEVSLGGKWVETLKEVSPSLAQVAILYEPAAAPYMAGMIRSVASAGPSFGVEVKDVPIQNIGELESAIARFGQQENTGLILPPSVFAGTHSSLIVALAAKYRMPAIYASRTVVASGGLISYGIDVADQYTKVAGYVDRILKGEKPADLPVQAPTKYVLAINLKTAKALSLTIPPTLLARADEVVE